MTVLAIKKWRNNGELIADVAALGYLREEWTTLDCTYGKGTFWKVWRPQCLTTSDIRPGLAGLVNDFRSLPWPDRHFDCVVFDPPYMLTGRPQSNAYERFGVSEDDTLSWQDRMELIRDGLTECARVLGNGYLLLKCQDQVVSRKKRWQTVEFTIHAARHGLGLVDRFDFLSYRPQPEGRRQEHAHVCSSQLLVFKRGWRSGQLEVA